MAATTSASGAASRARCGWKQRRRMASSAAAAAASRRRRRRGSPGAALGARHEAEALPRERRAERRVERGGGLGDGLEERDARDVRDRGAEVGGGGARGRGGGGGGGGGGGVVVLGLGDDDEGVGSRREGVPVGGGDVHVDALGEAHRGEVRARGGGGVRGGGEGGGERARAALLPEGRGRRPREGARGGSSTAGTHRARAVGRRGAGLGRRRRGGHHEARHRARHRAPRGGRGARDARTRNAEKIARAERVFRR